MYRATFFTPAPGAGADERQPEAEMFPDGDPKVPPKYSKMILLGISWDFGCAS